MREISRPINYKTARKSIEGLLNMEQEIPYDDWPLYQEGAIDLLEQFAGQQIAECLGLDYPSSPFMRIQLSYGNDQTRILTRSRLFTGQNASEPYQFNTERLYLTWPDKT